MKHIRPTNDASKYLSAGYYGEDLTPPFGYEIIEGPPPVDAVQVTIKGLVERLNDIFDEQETALRAQFAPLKAAVRILIEDNDTEAAQAVIVGASIPQELEPVRAALLAEFN